MAKARPTHAAQRAIQQLTVGVAKSQRALADRVAELGLAEGHQQFQFPIQGTAGTLPGFATLDITFDFPFHYAPGQRDSDLEVPLMTFGSVADANVMVTCSVASWAQDNNGGYTGCQLRIATMGQVDFVTFTGHVHVNFQGFFAPDDTPADVGLEQ